MRVIKKYLSIKNNYISKSYQKLFSLKKISQKNIFIKKVLDLRLRFTQLVSQYKILYAYEI